MKTKLLIAIIVLVLCVIGFSIYRSGQPKAKIGVAIPSTTVARWKLDGENLRKNLEELNYQPMVYYSDENVEVQIAQIKEMIASGCKCLVIAPVDAYALNDVMAQAKAKGIKVIAYDRLIMNTDALSCYVTFDNFRVGRLMAWHILNVLKPSPKGNNPRFMEIVSGDINDTNSILIYKGAMSVLKPYLDNGSIVIKSLQSTLKETTTKNWSKDEAQARMTTLLTKFYAYNEPLNAVLVMNDSMALGVMLALEAKYRNRHYPVITGQDCDVANVKCVRDGRQGMTVFKDVRVLVRQTAMMVDAVMTGQPLPINDTKSYNNGVMNVPSYLSRPESVTRDNISKILLDSGFYTEADLKN